MSFFQINNLLRKTTEKGRLSDFEFSTITDIKGLQGSIPDCASNLCSFISKEPCKIIVLPDSFSWFICWDC